MFQKLINRQVSIKKVSDEDQVHHHMKVGEVIEGTMKFCDHEDGMWIKTINNKHKDIWFHPITEYSESDLWFEIYDDSRYEIKIK